MTYKRKQRAFTLIEMLITITALTGIMSVAYVGVSEMQASAKAQKLQQDIGVVNTAIKMYLAHGGSIAAAGAINPNGSVYALTSPQAIVNKLKTRPTVENHKQIVGIRGSMIDPRLEVVMQNVAQAESGEPRALWNSAKRRFDVVREGDPGVRSLRMNRTLLVDEPIFETRASQLKFASVSKWVWDYQDNGNGSPGSYGPVNVGSTSTIPFGLPNMPPGPIVLNPPSFSLVGGIYPLADYDVEVTLTDTNPGGSSQVFYTEDGATWDIYTGQTLNCEPDDTLQAIAVTLDPDNWADSEIAAESYTADPVELAVAIGVPQNPVNYAQAGGAMVAGGTPPTPVEPISVALTNVGDIPLRYQNSDTFNVVWSYDGSDPLVSPAGSGGTFSEGFPGAAIDYSLGQWGGSSSLPILVAAKSLDASVLLDSPVDGETIAIAKTALRAPVSNVADGLVAPDEQISLAPVSEFGDLPEGWRIFYTTDGSDPGSDANGNPVGGTLYAGAFEGFTGTGHTAQINTRVYGPGTHPHWFTPSPMFSLNITRYEVPEWEGYIGGRFSQFDYSFFRNIKQHRMDGVLDPSFNPGSGLNERGRAVALQADGQAIVGGAFTSVDGYGRNRIVRFNMDGSVDTSFDPGEGFDGEVLAVCIQPDGKVLVGGKFQTYDNVSCKGLARLNSDGSIDDSFNIGQAVHSDEDGSVHSIALQPSDGKIVVGGIFSRYNSNSAKCLVRIHADGSYDGSCDTTIGVSGYVNTVKIQPVDHKILIGGSFSAYNNQGSNNVARVLPGGGFDSTFDVGRGANKEIFALSIYDDGKVFIGGNFSDVNKVQRQGVARLHSGGSVDMSFAIINGEGVPSWIIYSSDIDSQGRVIAGGNLRAYNSQQGARAAFARLLDNGSVDYANYSPEDLPQHSYVYGIAIRPDDRALVTGAFDEAGTAGTENIAKVDPNTGMIDPTFDVGNGANSTVRSLIKTSDGNVMIGGSFSEVKETYRGRVAVLSPTGDLQSFNPNISWGSVYAIAEQPDGKFVVGGSFRRVNGVWVYRIARLNSDGSRDTGFDVGSGFNGTVRSVAVSDDGKILVGGHFTSYNGVSARSVVLLNPDGSRDTSVSATDNTVYHVMFLPSGKMLYAGSMSGKIKVLNADGSTDNTFVPASINGTVRSVALKQDGKLVIGGYFTNIDGSSCLRSAGLTQAGALDGTFNASNGADDSVYKIIAIPDGGAAAFGQFENYGGVSREGIVRLNPDGSNDGGFTNPAIEVNYILATK